MKNVKIKQLKLNLFCFINYEIYFISKYARSTQTWCGT